VSHQGSPRDVKTFPGAFSLRLSQDASRTQLSSNLLRNGSVYSVLNVPPDIFPECIMIRLRRAGRALHVHGDGRCDGGLATAEQRRLCPAAHNAAVGECRNVLNPRRNVVGDHLRAAR